MSVILDIGSHANQAKSVKSLSGEKQTLPKVLYLDKQGLLPGTCALSWLNSN